MEPESKQKNPAAVALGQKRWVGISAEDRTAAGRKAADARNRKLTAARKREIALAAARAAAIAAKKRREENKSASRKSKASKA